MKGYSFPAKEIREGRYSDKYFVRSRLILEKDRHHPKVDMQVFCRKEALLCGVDEAVRAIRRGCFGNPRKLAIYSLREGSKIRPWESVMRIVGDYASFVHLETIYLGILTRRTSLATSVSRVVQATRGKPVLFFSSRFDHYLNQQGDGYAATFGGAASVSTEANTGWLKRGEAFGTIPHGLIAAYEGDTVRASLAFDRHMPKSIKRIALVDFDNDCVRTSLAVAQALGKRLWGVRLDTAGDIRDRSVRGTGKNSYGVCPELVRNVRQALDRAGYPWVKIIVSGGFNEQRIRELVRKRVPFDAVGIGSSLLHERVEFTADIVKVDGKPCSKVGRRFRPNRSMRKV